MQAVSHLRGLGCKDIEFSPEDAGRSDPQFLYRVLAAVIQAGATTVNIPDTTGERDLSALQGMELGMAFLMHACVTAVTELAGKAGVHSCAAQ